MEPLFGNARRYKFVMYERIGGTMAARIRMTLSSRARRAGACGCVTNALVNGTGLSAFRGHRAGGSDGRGGPWVALAATMALPAAFLVTSGGGHANAGPLTPGRAWGPL